MLFMLMVNRIASFILYPLSLSASTASGLSALKPAAMAGNGVGERLNS